MEKSLHAFLIYAVGGHNWSASCPRESLRYLRYRKVGETPENCGNNRRHIHELLLNVLVRRELRGGKFVEF